MSTAIYVPGFGRPINVRAEALPDDSYDAVAFTIQRMRQYAEEDASSPQVVAAVRDALRGVSPDAVSVCRAIWAWARNHVRFEADDVKSAGAGFGLGNEVLVRPVDLLTMQNAAEDCDGFSMLVASMLLAARGMLNIPLAPSFCTLATNPKSPREFTHVYVWCSAGDAGAFALDSSHGPSFGWEQPNRFGMRQLWPVGGYQVLQQASRQPMRAVSRASSVQTVPAIDREIFATFPALRSTGLLSGLGFDWGALTNELISAGTQIGVTVLKSPGTQTVSTPGGGLTITNPLSAGQSLGSALPWIIGGVVLLLVAKR